MNHFAGERSPVVGRHPELAAGGVVHHARHERERQIVCLRFVGAMMHRHVAVKAALTRGIDARLRHPAALLITHGDDVVRADAHAVRIAKAGGVHVQFCTVGRDAQDRAAVRVALGALGEKEVPLRVRLEVGVKRVAAAGGEYVVVKILVVIRLAIAIEIVQAGDLVAPNHVAAVVDDL